MRSITELVSDSFIWGVGITRPKPGKERQAAMFITAMLVGVVLSILGVLFFGLHRF